MLESFFASPTVKLEIINYTKKLSFCNHIQSHYKEKAYQFDKLFCIYASSPAGPVGPVAPVSPVLP